MVSLKLLFIFSLSKIRSEAKKITSFLIIPKNTDAKKHDIISYFLDWCIISKYTRTFTGLNFEVKNSLMKIPRS
jgi:hypothetical protein